MESYEKWWTNNLGNETYTLDGKEVEAPTCESFETWMGDKDSEDRVFIRNRHDKLTTFLDAGCGACPEYFGLMEINPEVEYTGMDITQKLVDYNLGRGINCVQGSLNNIPFENNSFDVVLSRHVVEHMSNIEKPLSELIRVSKHKVVICFFIDPMINLTNCHLIKLDEEGTLGEVYHNNYSKVLIDELLESIPKVVSVEWVPTPPDSVSTSILEIFVS